MRRIRAVSLFHATTAAGALIAGSTIAQGPSVLTLQTSHHVMGHGLSIEQGTGLVRSEVRQGTFTFAPN